MTTRYLSVEELKTYARSELPTVDDNAYEAAINAAELYIDNKTARRFVVATTSTARVYRPSNGCLQVIDDCTTITSVVDNGTTLTVGTDYQAEPLNNLTEAGDATPYYMLRRLGYLYNRWYNWYGIPGQASITVTAAWGWSAIPAPIKEACKIVAKDYLLQRNTNNGLVAVTDAGGVGMRDNPMVAAVLARYAHPNAIVVGV